MASVLGNYQIRLKDQTGTYVAVFDDWQKLTYARELNGVGSYAFTINGDDTRIPDFVLDGQFEIWRSVPGLNKDWYLEHEFLCRSQERSTTDTGLRTFTSKGVGYNDFLARTVIAYKEGTIRAQKDGPSETVMKEYVAENCAGDADNTAVGRLNFDEHLNDGAGALVYNSVLPGFTVDLDLYRGPEWSGERAYENLLSTLQDIANVTGMDYTVTGTGPATFVFKTYENGYGLDRRYLNVDSATGLNTAGNVPVMFSIPFGSVKDLTYTYDRTAEANAVMVLGEGQLSLREVYTVADLTAISASPWNRREITRPGSNQQFDYQFRQVGDEALKTYGPQEKMDFDPLQIESLCYGVNYNLGDKVSAQYDDILLHKKIVKVEVSVAAATETITITFNDIP